MPEIEESRLRDLGAAGRVAALEADLSDRPGYTAQPPSECLNGCETRQGSPASKVHCEPGQMLCPRCAARLDKWLRGIPDAYALLPRVVMHGSVPSDPGTKRTKRPDPPAPMRLEVVDLLNTKPGYGVLGIVHSWAQLVRDERHLVTYCTCTHARPSHNQKHCTALGCGCRKYTPGPFYVYAECQVILANLAWCTEQGFAGDLYDEIRRLARDLNDTVGEYRPKPVGKCAALRPDPDDPDNRVLCGGALVMDKPKPDDEDQTTSVRCLSCNTRHEANAELRALGLLVDRIFRKSGTERQAS